MTSQTDPVSTDIPTLGRLGVDSPLKDCAFVDDAARLSLVVPGELTPDGDSAGGPLSLLVEEAGPRQKLFFDPPKTKCAVVTCGGLCPGTNDVIRAIVMEAHHHYRAAAVLGIRHGLMGFIQRHGYPVLELSPDRAASIHQFGGSILGSSRGPEPAGEIVEALDRLNVSILFMIGGDGTLRAAETIRREIETSGLKIGVVCIPKTIDNDIAYISRSFGFDSAVAKATEAIRCARIEAMGAYNGIGVVKLMGRDAGFIAAHAVLAIKEANFVLVPEDPFELHGEKGFLAALRRRVTARGHAVVVVAEGAGQHLCHATGQADPSGNPVLADFCELLVANIKHHLTEQNIRFTLKQIDPSYIIRSVPAGTNDQVFCGFLGRNAVHAGFAGKTGVVVANLQERFVHLPLAMVAGRRKRIRTTSDYWRSVLETTGQPAHMR